MWCRAISGLAFLLAVVPAAAGAATRVGALEVREGNHGLPCFSISREEEARAGAPDFQSIAVSAADSPKTPAWSMAMPPQRTFAVSFLMCIPYGGRLPVLPQTPAAPLVPGRVYDVAIEVRPPQPARTPRSYRGRFCMGRRAPLVRQPWADAKGRLFCPA